MTTKIISIAYFFPKNALTNTELSNKFPDWTSDRIEEKIGIKQRHYVDENQTSLDIAEEACNNLFKIINKELIDFILLCTQSPDYFLPTSACILQDRLGLKKEVGALDYNLGCSGFIYGLALSKGLISSGIASNVLLVTAETYSKFIHPEDKANLSIFGDGATATLVSSSDRDQIKEFVLGTDGSGYRNLIVEVGGLRSRKGEELTHINENGIFQSPGNLFMNGPEIFNFTIEVIPLLIEHTLQKNSLKLDDINYFIFHQANKYILDYLRKKLKIPKEKFYSNMLMTGNTVSSTIPIALKDCLETGIINNGDKVMLVGFGVGYSWGATIIEI